MRSALLLLALLLTSLLAVAPTASAVDCAGNIDAACNTNRCTTYSTSGCVNYAPAFCVVWARQPQVFGEPVSEAACIQTLGGDGCGGLVDVVCKRTVCTQLSYDGCERYETLTCVVYADVTVGGTYPTDYTCIPNTL